MINYSDMVLIEGLSLITSCGCNLQCQYCRISESRNSNSAFLQEETIKSLKNGDFLSNIQLSMQRLHQSTAQIRNIAFWGQEPTLTLQYITENWKNWADIFPNLSNIFFSTNAMDYMDRIYEFLIAVDTYATHPIQINIQFSYDGDESTNNIREANSSKIFQNIKYLLEKLNVYQFHKIKFIGCLHGVVSIEMLNKLTSIEKIENYYQNMYSFGGALASIVTNKSIDFDPIVGLALENPVNATAEEGIKLANFLNLSLRVDSINLSPYGAPARIIDHFFNNYITKAKYFMGKNNLHSISELLEKCVMDKDFIKVANTEFSSYIYCANGSYELKFMYDGTLVNCQNSMFETQEEFLPINDSLENAIKHSMAKEHYFINLLTASDEEINNYFYKFKTLKFSSFFTIFSSAIILMKFLVQINQIDLSYNNPQKLLNHAFKFALYNCCHYNNLVKTGSMLARHTGQIRFFCNGLIDCFDHVLGEDL